MRPRIGQTTLLVSFVIRPLWRPNVAVAFPIQPTNLQTSTNVKQHFMALGDYTLELEKPLGIILEQVSEDGGGVYVKEIGAGGSAAASNQIVPRDVLLNVDDTDVSQMNFDSVMDLFLGSKAPTVRVTLGDGLGVMDMPKNVIKQLKSPEDAYFVDAIVREAVREIRKNGRLGDVINVEVIVGAGVPQKDRGMVRFFAIFSTDGVSTYSCNVSATGVRQDDDSIQIISLSCAKDEGLGRTFDLIQEEL
jgi:hypothetical protein